jgi:hypothetical protein
MVKVAPPFFRDKNHHAIVVGHWRGFRAYPHNFVMYAVILSTA